MTTINTFNCPACQRASASATVWGITYADCKGCAARSIAASPGAHAEFKLGQKGAVVEMTKAVGRRQAIKPDAEFRAQVKAWFSHFSGGNK
jgi:hypothetical protein